MALCLRRMYRFGEFELTPSERAFLRNGKSLSVSPKAFEVLTYLVTNPGRVVTKSELLQAVWPDSFVEEGNLTQHISWLRKALGDHASYIATVPGRGYQFTPAVQVQSPSEALPVNQDILVQRVRERTHLVIEETSPMLVAPVTVGSTGPRAERWFSIVRLAAANLCLRKIVGTLAVVAALGAAAYISYIRLAFGPIHRAISIAVLPFTNLTGDPAKEYLCDGVTEEMINVLARAEGGQLRVIARTSSMCYKGTHKTVRRIARELGVQYVLEGSLQSEGSRLHVSAQLIRGNDETHFWADTFDGDAGQILEFETDLTQAVAHSLSLTLLTRSAPEHAPVNYAAHDAYLQGLNFVSQRSQSGFQNALRSFARAIAQDPHYARAYAQLAVTYNLMGQYNWMDTPQARSQAQAAAQQAVALDANLAEAHAALGFNHWFYDWDSAAAEAELLQAIRLEPTNVDARHWYANVLMAGARWDEAEKQMRAALGLDPKALILRTNLGWLHYLRRQYHLAIQEIQAVVRDNPDFITAHYKLWWIYSAIGDVPHARNELQTIARLMFTPENKKKIAALDQQEGYAASLKALVVFSGGYYWQGLVDDARCMAFAGDQHAALEYLDRALKSREGWMVFVEVDPAFDSLRSEPEYARIAQEFQAQAVPMHSAYKAHSD